MAPLINYARQLADGIIKSQHLNRANQQRYTFDPFDAPPHFKDSLGNGVAVGTTSAINLCITNRGIYEWHVLGAGQTIAVPVYDRVNGLGLDFGQDQTISEGHQLRFSPNIVTAGMSRGKHSYTIGTDKAWFARLKVRCSDTSGLVPLVFALWKNQAYQTALASYTDYVGFNISGSGASAQIRQQTSVASVVVTLDTTQTWLDNTSRTFEIRVTQAGKVSFLIDGAVPTVPMTTFSLASGIVVSPGTFFLHGADLADNLWYQEFESGFLPTRAE